jgi:hypothetical protein
MAISPQEALVLFHRWFYGSPEAKTLIRQLTAHIFAAKTFEVLQENLQDWCIGCQENDPDVVNHQCVFTAAEVSNFAFIHHFISFIH